MTSDKSQKIRVLFLGEMISSHAQSWMGLLDPEAEDFELMGFGVPGSPYPVKSKVKLFDPPGHFINSMKLPNWIRKALLHFLILTFRPHIIHSFAAFPTAALYRDVIMCYQPRLKWVVQVRGGPDVYINRLDHAKKESLVKIFRDCDVLIADNEINYNIAVEMGLSPDKRWSYGIAPGTGGVDLNDFPDAVKPSEAVKQVIWTKAYEGYESKGLPVLEAIKMAWPSIRGTKFVFAAVNPDLEKHLSFLPQEIKDHISLHHRLPRQEILSLMQKSRVVMAPSLLEGIPNSLYEAMASKSVPIYSPLETYVDKFKDNENVLYARNLFPEEIAAALIKALNDDVLADKIAENNVKLVPEIAGRQKVSKNLISLYRSLAKRT